MTQARERSATLSELVAEEIRALMARQRTSGRQLAAKLDVSPSWVSYRLSGVQPIDVNDLVRIAKALDVGVYDLLPPPEVAADAVVPKVTSSSSAGMGTAKRRGRGTTPNDTLASLPSRFTPDATRTPAHRPLVAGRCDSTRPASPIGDRHRRPVSKRPPTRPIAA